jgi:oligopeptide transport system permease protein
MIPVFIGTTFLIFVMVHVLPGDPVRAMFGDKAADPTVVATLRHRYHLDEPLLTQYWLYLSGLVRGDFGISLANGDRPVTAILAQAWPITARLGLMAFGVELVFGVLLGLAAGLRRGRLFDNVVLALTLVVISIPIFVLAYVAQIVLGLKLHLVSATVSGGAPVNELILPAIVLGSLSLAYVSRLTRTSVVENLRSDFIRTAIAKGLPRRRVIGVHLLRTSLIPVVTFLGTDLGALMGGAIVTERVFNITGVGFNIFKAIELKDGPTSVGLVTVLVIIFLFSSLVVDLLYAVLDPRIRYA